MESKGTSTILIRGARQLLTLRGPVEPRRGSALRELGIIHDGSLLIRDGVLIEVGATRRVENLTAARGAVEVSAAGRVIVPGFVDSHTHLLFPPPGSFEGRETQSLYTTTGMRLETQARLHLESMARHGTTLVEVKTGCGPDATAEMKILRVLAGLQRNPIDVMATVLLWFPNSSAQKHKNRETILNWYCEWLPKVRRRRLAAFADVLFDEELTDPCWITRYLETARALGLSYKVHAQQEHPSAAVALAVDYGATTIDHLENAVASDARLLAGSSTIATLLPCASFHSGSRYAPARMLIDSGVAVALATNYNPGHTPTLNMQAAVKLACLHMGMTPAEAISAATINGAHALGCAGKTGSLEPGKSADLLLLNISDYRDLAHHFGSNLVYRTMKRGEFIYEEGEVAPRPLQSLRPAW